jgi:hypothetical protein
MGKTPHEPLRCASCGSAIALDELEAAGTAWAGRQDFSDWDVVPDTDILESVQSAKFVGLHPSFAAGAMCPSCQHPFTIGEAADPYGIPYSGDEFGEVPF